MASCQTAAFTHVENSWKCFPFILIFSSPKLLCTIVHFDRSLRKLTVASVLCVNVSTNIFPSQPAQTGENSRQIVLSVPALLYLDGRAEVVEAPGDDDVVVAADQGSHHGRPIADPTEAGVDLEQEVN